jgi:hypothetical protein
MYSYENIDDLLNKYAFINSTGAGKLYDHLKNIILKKDSFPEEVQNEGVLLPNTENKTSAIEEDLYKVANIEGISNKLKNVGKGVVNLAKNTVDPNTPVNTGEYKKVNEEELKNILLSFNRFYTQPEINGIIQYISENGGVVSKISKNQFVLDIASKFPFNDAIAKQIEDFLSEKNLQNLRKTDNELFKILLNIKTQHQVDTAVKDDNSELVKIISKKFPGYKDTYSIAEISDAFKNSKERMPVELQELEKNPAIPENKVEEDKKIKEEVTSKLLLKVNEYSSEENKKQYNNLLKTLQKNPELSYKLNTSANDRIKENFTNILNLINEQHVNNENYNKFEFMLSEAIPKAFNNTVNNILSDVKLPKKKVSVKDNPEILKNPKTLDEYNTAIKENNKIIEEKKKLLKERPKLKKDLINEIRMHMKINQEFEKLKQPFEDKRKQNKEVYTKAIQYLVLLKLKEQLGETNG